ncbi:hypothetical protein C5167_024964 [Papaver somniferum]|uniref:TNase-like domain-containing protein n=1 Tax=Papaver somniferum TaxID=3469 RepID=A0A4Y7JQ27_PAPSO|nr:hypothetical protein C5167_024964 [Papaver somniferum]
MEEVIDLSAIRVEPILLLPFEHLSPLVVKIVHKVGNGRGFRNNTSKHLQIAILGPQCHGLMFLDKNPIGKILCQVPKDIEVVSSRLHFFNLSSAHKPIDHQEYDLLGHHGVSTATVGVSALAHDVFHFDITSQVPERLKGHAWKEANQPPKTPEQTSRLVIQTLETADDIEVHCKTPNFSIISYLAIGLLKFYGLPVLRARVEVPAVVAFPPTASLPEGGMFVLQEFRVDSRCVPDGDCLTVYVDVADPREARNVPKVVQEAVSQRLRARANMDYATADACYKKIVDAGYRLLRGTNNEHTLTKRYRVRLRGIDAPEIKMPYGQEAKEELTKLVEGKCLTVHVYGVDPHGRLVGDVHCNGIFVQEVMLKKGGAWNYSDYGNSPELAKWEMEARAARVGLWALSNPEKPWEWRKKNPEMPWDWRIPNPNPKLWENTNQ